MKRHRNRSKHKKELFEAVLRKWHLKKLHFGGRSCKNHFTQAVIVNAIGAAAFLTVGATGALAKDDPTLMPEVVVTGRQEQEGTYKPEEASSPKYTEPLRDIPQTITVIPQAVMQEQGATSLRDVLRNVPGISIQAGEGGVPAGDNLSVRGFSARTDMFVDGVRDFGGYTRDPFNFEQIEVIKGPASSYSGRGSTGGSLNMVSKAPRPDAFYAGSLGGGTDKYQRYTFDVNQPIANDLVDGAAFRLNGMYHDADVPGRDVVRGNRWGVAPSVAFGLETPTRLTISYFHLEQDNIPDYGIPWVPTNNTLLPAHAGQAAPVDFSNFYGLKARDYETTVTDVGTILTEHDFNETLSLRNLFRYGYNDRDSIITAPRFANTTTPMINRNAQSRDQQDAVLASQTDFIIKFDTADIEHTLVPGFEFVREVDSNRARTMAAATQTDLFTPNPDDPYTGSIVPAAAKSEAVSKSNAVYIFDTVKFTEQWELTGGLRWDQFDLNFTPAGSPKLGRTDDMLTWRTGVVYKPVEHGSIYAAYGTSFNPSAESLTLSSTATSANNVNIDPEESRTWEVGTKWDVLEERLSLTMAGFRTEKTNARTEDPADTTDIVVLSGEQRVDGIELGIAGSITEKWDMFAAYTFMHSKVVKSENPLEVGNELSNTPENTFSIWTTYQLPKNFEVGAGLQYVDTRYSSAVVGNPTNSRKKAPDYLLNDAMVAYHATEDITLRLNVYNIGDKEYIDRVGGGHFIPGAGRSAVISTDFKF